MRLFYSCCDCGRATYCEGLSDVPDPARCWTCHAVSVLSYIVPHPVLVEAERLGASAPIVQAAADSSLPVVIVVSGDMPTDLAVVLAEQIFDIALATGRGRQHARDVRTKRVPVDMLT